MCKNAKEIVDKLNMQTEEIMSIKYHYDLTDVFLENKNKEQWKTYDAAINYYLENIKKYGNKNIIYDERIDTISEFYEYAYNNDEEREKMINIQNEADEIVIDLVLKVLEENGRSIKIPIDLKNISQFCISSKIEKQDLKKVIWWIILKLSIISKLSKNK